MQDEENGLFRDRRVGFRRMIRIVEADGDEGADIADARADPRLSAHQRQARGLDLGQALQGFRVQRRSVNVVDDGGEVADAAFVINQPGFFLPGSAITHQFQIRLLWRARSCPTRGRRFQRTRRDINCRGPTPAVVRLDAAGAKRRQRKSRSRQRLSSTPKFTRRHLAER